MKKTQLTTKHIRHLLPRLLGEIGRTYRDRPDLILASWSDVVGSKIASMTKAVSFREGILTVKVQNSTLYSILQADKSRLIKGLRDKFPKTTIKTILFRL